MEELPKWRIEDVNGKEKSYTNVTNYESTSSQRDNPVIGLTKTASWHSLKNSDLEGSEVESAYYESSQSDLLHDMGSHPHLEVHKHGYQLSYELALDNMLTPFASRPFTTYVHMSSVYHGL